MVRGEMSFHLWLAEKVAMGLLFVCGYRHNTCFILSVAGTNSCVNKSCYGCSCLERIPFLLSEQG
jgi:hypothetical protein